MTPTLISFIIGFMFTLIATIAVPASQLKVKKKKGDGDNPVVSHGLWIGLLLSTVLLGLVQGYFATKAEEMIFGFGPSLFWLCIVSVPLLILTLTSDFKGSKSERHLAGLILSGLGMALFGFHIYSLSSPLSGTLILTPILGVLLTIIWLILLTSILEVVSLIPLGVGLFTLALSGVVLAVAGLEHSIAASSLAGLLPGAVLGRTLAGKIVSVPIQYGKAEVFLLGLWTTAMLNISFLKSVALFGFVIPLSILTVALIFIMIQGFESSLLLRKAPGADSGN